MVNTTTEEHTVTTVEETANTPEGIKRGAMAIGGAALTTLGLKLRGKLGLILGAIGGSLLTKSAGGVSVVKNAATAVARKATRLTKRTYTMARSKMQSDDLVIITDPDGPPKDIIEVEGELSFPASDPPANY